MTKKTIYIGSDHGGFELKEKLKIWLEDQQYTVEDLGASSLVPKDDYPDYAIAVAKKVAEDEKSLGILLCRSGGGMVIAANKVKGIRAISAHDEKSAIHAREHNDADIISISADWVNEEQSKNMLSAFLSTPFSGVERHVRRINKIKEFENKS